MKIPVSLKIGFVAASILLGSLSEGFAQKSKEKDKKESKADVKKEEKEKAAYKAGKVSAENFAPEQVEALILKKINAYRGTKGLDSLRADEILEKAAADQAGYMAKKEEVTKEQSSGKKKDTGARVVFYGGSESADEVVISQAANKGKEFFSYDDLAGIIVDKWIKGKASLLTMVNPTYIYVGVGVVLEPASKKVYASVVFGSFNTFNIGAEKRNELAVPFTTKKFRLKKPINEKECKSCAKFAEIDNLQKGLYVKDDIIYFKYPQLKAMKKLLNDKRDGLAVDVVQKEQYPCAPYNIYDTKRVNKGVMLKRKWSKKIFKHNLVTDPKSRSLDVMLGKLPKGITGEYELNLMVIQDKQVCRVITRKYLEDGGIQSFTPLDLYPDTTDRKALKYKPVAEVKVLTFNVPFNKNNANYAPEDIKPFIESLNEPDFKINSILLTAYSSIEGDSSINTKLQRERGENIMKAIQKMQTTELPYEIKTDDSWDLFKKQVIGTKYAGLGGLTKADAKKAIDDTGLEKEMEESILSKERFAEIKLSITYDISTPEKEQRFVIRAFKNAVEKKDAAAALNIQQYMIAQALQNKYKADDVINAAIPTEKEYASHLINKIWLNKFINKDTLNDDLAAKINAIAKMNPKNDFASYNSLVCNVKLSPLGKEKTMDSVQTKIQDLYNTKLNKDRIDAMNLEYQFKIIDALDAIDGAKPIVAKSIDRIRGIYKIEGSSWQNALKLAYIFIKNNDLDYSSKILEPFVDAKDVDENLLYTYISLMSYYPDKLITSKFAGYLHKAKELNEKRYCKLFGEPYLSFQILDNPFVKADYCKYCAGAVQPKINSTKGKK
jgi:uncharacterized protein YkwD